MENNRLLTIRDDEARADPGIFNRGGGPNNLRYRGRGTNERSVLRAKRVTSEVNYERSEL